LLYRRMPRLFAALALDGAPSLHVCVHFAERLALEPAHMPAGHVAAPGFLQALDPPPITFVEIETCRMTLPAIIKSDIRSSLARPARRSRYARR
jgi:hypothetical protein